MSDSTPIDQPTYFDTRMNALGITDNYNKIALRHTNTKDVHGPEIDIEVPIFRPSPKGIDILVYTIDGDYIMWLKEKKKVNKFGKEYDKGLHTTRERYCITRLETPITTDKGETIKYLKPKAVPSYPFFPPFLVKKYKAGIHIPVLYLTEGFFKAFKADMNDIACVGMQSITCLRDKETNTIYEDIVKLIEKCRVKRIVWLTDGDCLDLTTKELTDKIDLFRRPNSFYSSVYTFYELTSNIKECERYFAYINSEEISKRYSKPKHMVKGLDDVLVELKEELPFIRDEFENFSIVMPGKVYPGQFITKINITNHPAKVKEHFCLHNVNEFYKYHSERRTELNSLKKFLFNGTTYRWDFEKSEAIIEIPAEASDYIRVGNNYFKSVEKPTKFFTQDGSTIKTLSGRDKGTITDDHGKNFIKHIVKYNEFTVVPDHVNYQRIIHNCYNMYNPFQHEPEQGDCENILNFIKHIFGTQLVEGIPRYELGLDYLTLLYKRPQQTLPILCLVSEDRQTGKSTFGRLLSWIFVDNTISIGNEDMKGDFNAHFANKLAIICDETKIDSHEVIQKIKRLSTEDSIVMNAKGKDQVTLPFFAKFILMSNSTDDFIRIDKKEIRFWVLNVPALKEVDVRLNEKMRSEIPAFIYYLNDRKMLTSEKERHWFDTKYLQTEELAEVKEYSTNKVQKAIVTEIAELFMATGEWRLTLPLKFISGIVLKNDPNYVARIVRSMGYKTKLGVFKYPHKFIDKYEPLPNQKVIVIKEIEWAKVKGKYYEFFREAFVSAEEINVGAKPKELDKQEEIDPVTEEGNNDLPF